MNLAIVNYVKNYTKRGKNLSNVKLSDRPWNDPGPVRGSGNEAGENEKKPDLRAIVLDFSTV